MTIIAENTFAAACYDQNTTEDLELGLLGEADEADMDAWGITAQEWREQIELAICALREDAE